MRRLIPWIMISTLLLMTLGVFVVFSRQASSSSCNTMTLKVYAISQSDSLLQNARSMCEFNPKGYQKCQGHMNAAVKSEVIRDDDSVLRNMDKFIECEEPYGGILGVR